MYFSQNKKPAERRANDEYRRRMVDARPAPKEEDLPASAISACQTDPPDSHPECPLVPGNSALAMVYAPKQAFENLYEPKEALARGTLFAALDLPFHGRSVTRR